MGAGRKSKYNDDIVQKIKGWNAALYLRLSSEDGDKDVSNSIISQRQVLDEFISKNSEIKIFDYYIDDGYSGTNFERPAFKRMFLDMQSKKINAIIVKDLSRLGRNYLEAGNYIEQIFPLFDVRFISVNDNIDSYLSPSSVSNISVPLKNLMNEQYCKEISNKVKATLDVMRKNGKYISGIAPYGYIKDPEDKHHLIVDKESAEVVKLIYNLCLSGLGGTKIARELNNRNILNPTYYRKKKYNKEEKDVKSYWTSSMVSKILENQIYCGDMVQGKSKMFNYKIHKRVEVPEEQWQIVENTHEAIIDREIFEKVKKTRTKRLYSWNKNKTNISVFAGHLKCADCGGNMIKVIASSRKVKGNTIRKYAYICSTHRNKSNEICSKHYLKEEDLRLTITRSLKYHINLLTDFEKVQEYMKNNKNEDEKINGTKRKITKLNKELENIKLKKIEIYEDWKLDKIDEGQYYEYTKDYIDKKTNIENQIEKYQQEILDLEKITAKTSNNIWAERLSKYKDVSVLTKNMIDELIDDIYIYEDRRMKINFKYRDEYKIAMDYLKQYQN